MLQRVRDQQVPNGEMLETPPRRKKGEESSGGEAEEEELHFIDLGVLEVSVDTPTLIVDTGYSLPPIPREASGPLSTPGSTMKKIQNCRRSRVRVRHYHQIMLPRRTTRPVEKLETRLLRGPLFPAVLRLVGNYAHRASIVGDPSSELCFRGPPSR